jgi:hypothetical protein
MAEVGNKEITKERKKIQTPRSFTFCVMECRDSDLHTLQLLCQGNDRAALLLCKAGLNLGDERGQFNLDTLLLGVVLVQTHLLDLDLAGRKLVLADDDTEWNAAVLSSLELLLGLGLGLVGELSLEIGVSTYYEIKSECCGLP